VDCGIGRRFVEFDSILEKANDDCYQIASPSAKWNRVRLSMFPISMRESNISALLISHISGSAQGPRPHGRGLYLADDILAGATAHHPKTEHYEIKSIDYDFTHSHTCEGLDRLRPLAGKRCRQKQPDIVSPTSFNMELGLRPAQRQRQRSHLPRTGRSRSAAVGPRRTVCHK